MSESFSNTNSSAYSTSTVTPVGTNAPQVAANSHVEKTTVPVVEGGNSNTNTPAEKNIPQAHFDSETHPISIEYARRYLSETNQAIFTYDKNSDVSYSLTNSLANSTALKDAFLRDFKHQARERNSYTESQQLFASLNNQNYTYGRVYFQGSWINTRTPIDENGNVAGLPEMLTV